MIDLWTCPSSYHQNMSLHIENYTAGGSVQMNRSWELIISISNWEAILTGLLKLFWKFKMIHETLQNYWWICSLKLTGQLGRNTLHCFAKLFVQLFQKCIISIYLLYLYSPGQVMLMRCISDRGQSPDRH